MTTTAPIPPITGTVTIAVAVERAFAVFTGSINSWWPHQFHIGAAEVAEVVLEPHLAGRWYERGVDGSECDWGRVWSGSLRTGWCSPGRSTVPGSSTPTPSTSEIEARFTAVGVDQTTVEVEHRHFDRLVGGQGINDAIQGGGGWALLLDGFAKTVADKT